MKRSFCTTSTLAISVTKSLLPKVRMIAVVWGLVLTGLLGLDVSFEAGASNLVWDDDNNSVDKNWSNQNNWDPNNLPDGSCDLFIGVDATLGYVSTAYDDHTLVDQNFVANSITLGNGANIINSPDGGVTTFEIQVNHHVLVGADADRGGVIVLYEAPPGRESLDTNTLTITDTGMVTLNSNEGELSILEVDDGLLDLQNGGYIGVDGHGRIELNDNPVVPTILMNMDGCLDLGYYGHGHVNSYSLQITATSDNALIDLDGLSANGSIRLGRTLFQPATLDIDVRISDPVNNDITLVSSVLDIQYPWTFGSGTRGTLDVRSWIASEITGGDFTIAGGTVTLPTADDCLLFRAVLNATGGTIDNSGHIIFDANASVGPGVDFQMNGADASITVRDGVTVNIDDADFNPDGNGTQTNIITIGSGANLDLDLGAGADENFNNRILLNGGELDVTTADNDWSLTSTGNITVGTNTGTSHVNGETFRVSGHITVEENSILNIAAPAIFQASADVNVEAGAELDLDGSVTFHGGSYSGNGLLDVGPINTVEVATTIDVATIDLDAGSWTLNEDLTLNVASIDPAGDGFDRTINIPVSTAMLTVNLPGAKDRWSIDAAGTVNFTGSGSIPVILAGSDLDLAGTVNVTNNGAITAVTDLSGTININTAGNIFRFTGGTLSERNRISGGTINGPGRLWLPSNEALDGFGTIAADVDFEGSAELLADDGTLNVSTVLNVGTIGTADTDGVLNVIPAWNTNVAQLVDLNGGELRGGAITNDGAAGINGNGLVTARVVNNTRIDAENGGTLRLLNISNDWDGSLETGQLNALAGNLELVDTGLFGYSATASIGNGRELYVNGFDLKFDTNSTLALTGGTLLSNVAQQIEGAVTVNTNPSRLQTDSTIEPTANVTLNDDLNLDGNTMIEAGTTFAGGAALVNLPSSTLTIDDTANVGVLVENQGTLVLGASPGQTTGTDFQQTATGVWEVELMGTGLNDFDCMNLTGAALLAGTIDLSLLAPYVPSFGDTLNILSASGGIGGTTFNTVLQPVGMPAGLKFGVNYLPTIVQLEVVNIPIFTADFDEDGNVDGDDLTQWEGDFGLNGDSDADDDGDSDGADFLTWQRQFGSGLPVTATSTGVPEPGSLCLLLLGVAAMVGTQRRR